MAYELYYWNGIPGRGEFVRLALEEAGADYVDVCRQEGGEARMIKLWRGATLATPSFAPPFLIDGETVVGQVAAILLHLGGPLRLAPRAAAGRLWTHQIQLTIADLTAEAHDTHHPLGGDRYYQDQKPEALRRAGGFRDKRLPRFLGWFESILARNPAGPRYLVGRRLTYADLSLFHVVEGLRYAFPKASARALAGAPLVAALAARVAERPRIAAYLASPRRLAFNEDGIFRNYPELDG